MYEDWPPASRAVAERLRPLLCRHGVEYRSKGGARQIRACWPHIGGSKNPWVAILYCADGGAVRLKLRVSRNSGLLPPDGPLARSADWDRTDSERDTGSYLVTASFPPALPAWVEAAFEHCAERYGVELDDAPPATGPTPPAEFTLPDEVPAGGGLVDGAVRTVTVKAYERSPEVRRQCIAAHGTDCSVCGLSMGAEYGPVADGYIHVHHLRPLSEVRAAHAVDPVADLRPVCPNCHAVIHLRVPPYSIDDVRGFR